MSFDNEGWCRKGCSRTVFLTKNYALKFPGIWRWGFIWSSFLKGLLANMQEYSFKDYRFDNKLAPISFYIIGGFLVVMPRARTMTEEEWHNFDYDCFIKHGEAVVPVENKMCSIKILYGRPVAVDYGN